MGYKRALWLAPGLVVLSGLFSVTASAATTNPQCEAFNDKKTILLNNVARSEQRISGQQPQTNANLQKEVYQRDNLKTGLRKAADKTLAKNLGNLGKKAKTTTHKEALKAYKTSVESIVQSHRLAQDKAESDYSAGLNALLGAYRAELAADTTAMKAQFDAVVSAAVQSCYVIGPQKAQVSIKPGVIAAQTAYLNSRSGAQNAAPQITALDNARKAALAAAGEAQKTNLTTARETLGDAFGKDKKSVLGR